MKTKTQNLWAAVWAIFRGKFMVTQAYLQKQEKSPVNNLTLYLKELEEEQQQNPKSAEGRN